MTATAAGGSPVLIDGRYRLLERTGSAPSASVWRAADERLRRAVEITVYDEDVPSGDDARAALGLMARTAGPGLVTVLDAGDDLVLDGRRRVYTVTEPVDDPPLDRMCRSVTLQPATVAAIGSSVAATLAFLHAHGAVHGRLEACRVLVAFESEQAVLGDPPPRCATKLAGFGTAALLGRGDATTTDDLRALGQVLRAALGRPDGDPPAGWGELLRALDGPTPPRAASVSAQLATLAMTSGPAAACPTPSLGRRARARHARRPQRRWGVVPVGAR